MSLRTLTFTVYGTPQPAGSKRAFAYRKKGGEGKLGVRVTDDNPKGRDWKGSVAQVAGQAMNASNYAGVLFEGPLRVRFNFMVARPKGHYGKRGLRPAAPPWPDKKPDALKLSRGTEDALTGVVWRDDAQVVKLWISKEYGSPEGVAVTVEEMT